MSDKLTTLSEAIAEKIFHKLLELFVTLKVNSVPELGLAFMEVVDAVKVQVFFVPPKHSLPTTKVYIGIIHSQYFLIAKTLTEILQN